MAIVHLTAENFKEEVLESKVPVLIDFWATWCGPCQMVAPVIEELAEELTDVKICKVDVDAEPELARQYRVMSIPMFYVFKDGQVANRCVGAQGKEALLELLK
jgi:thioredoxin 1